MMEKPGTLPVKKHAARKAAPKESAGQASIEAKKPSRSRKKSEVSPEMRHQMIAEAAYFRAEQYGHGGDHVEHWLVAEAEIDTMLGKKG